MSIFEADLTSPMARADGVLSERVDDDLVVYDEQTQMAHCLSPEVASVWRHCDGRTSSSQIASELQLPPGTVGPGA
jgi:hypothetical protein